MWAASGVLRPRDAGKATGEGTRSATWQSSRDWSGTSCGLFPPLPGRCLGSTSSLPYPGLHLVQGKAGGLPSTSRLPPLTCAWGAELPGQGILPPACACVHAMWVHVRECEQVRGVGTCVCRCRGEGVHTAECRRRLYRDEGQSESIGAPGPTQPPPPGFPEDRVTGSCC